MLVSNIEHVTSIKVILVFECWKDLLGTHNKLIDNFNTVIEDSQQ